MQATRVASLGLALALPAFATASAAADFFPIRPCAVVAAGDPDTLRLDGSSRLVAIQADSCPISTQATEVLVEVAAIASPASGRVVMQPVARNELVPTTLEVAAGAGGNATTVVPLDRDLRGLLSLQVAPSGGAGTLAVTLAVIGYYERQSSFSGTAGFITTRPTCAPPGYTKDNLNYLQGPEPILLPSGDVTLLVAAGRCCTGHWEGLFALNYPAAGRKATPRFRGLWATNDFNKQRNRKEAELGFPSAMYYNGKWRIAVTTTFLPYHTSDRDRLGRLDLADLSTRAAASQVTNKWVKPVDPRCDGIASCPGDGSGLDPVLTMHPNGDLYVYHRDGNYLLCVSGYVRHRVAADLTVNSAQVDGCIRFEGLVRAPFLISDIARTADGRMLLLVEGPGAITEWTSTGDADHIGREWQPTGRFWPAPTHPNGAPWVYYVRDAAFLKDPSRNVVEPSVVVGQISDGTTYNELVNVQLGRWFLYYWADTGAPLPPTFGGPASSCAFQGAQESTSCTEVRGWAWDPMFASSPISVDVLADGVYQGTVPADQLRADLPGHGDGRHGFRWLVPAALRDGKKHKITVRVAEAADMLGKGQTIKCN